MDFSEGSVISCDLELQLVYLVGIQCLWFVLGILHTLRGDEHLRIDVSIFNAICLVFGKFSVTDHIAS